MKMKLISHGILLGFLTLGSAGASSDEHKREGRPCAQEQVSEDMGRRGGGHPSSLGDESCVPENRYL
jgi:hypothetical protein